MDDQLQRRVDDNRATEEVNWDGVATPLPESSIVYLARHRVNATNLWNEITTQENLAAVQGSPDQFVLRTLFDVPVADLARAPIAHLARARTELDRLERRTAVLERRVDDRHPGEPLTWEGEFDVLAMKAGFNELQAEVERSQKSSLNFMQIRTDLGAQAVRYIKYLAELAGKIQAGRCSAQGGNTSEETAGTASQSQAVPSELASLVTLLHKHWHGSYWGMVTKDEAAEINEAFRVLLSHSAATGKVPEEFVLMPKNPSEAVLQPDGFPRLDYARYQAMLAASPAVPVEKVKESPESMANSNTRFAIDGAIQYGRENRNPPPSTGHWLAEYWNIGRQLAKLGETGWDNMTPLAAPLAGRAEPEGYVLAPHFRGYAHLGIGAYILNHSSKGEDAELVISVATEEDKAGRIVGDLRDNAPDAVVQPESMAVRLRFENVAGLDALEQQLRLLRAEHFSAPLAAAVPAEEATGDDELDRIADAFKPEADADADAELRAGGPKRLIAFDYFKRGWMRGKGVLAAPVEEAKSHRWDDEGERCMDCGDKDWFAGSVCTPRAPAEPAPILASALTEQHIIAAWNETEAGGMVGRYIRFARVIERLARLSKPTAQGTAQSIDTPELDNLLEAYRNASLVFKAGEVSPLDSARAAIVEYIAAQAPAGRDAQEGGAK